MALYERGVNHRDVSIGNVLLGTDPSEPAGFIADLDFSSISDEAIKAAYPTEHETIISQLKHGEWLTVRFTYSVDGALPDQRLLRGPRFLWQLICFPLSKAMGLLRCVVYQEILLSNTSFVMILSH